MGAERRFRIGWRLLFWTLVAMTGFGLVVAVLDNRFVPGLHEAINRSMWGDAGMPRETVAYHRFLHGALGATIASWALALAFVVRQALATGARWAWWCVATSTLIWFVPDTTVSLALGVWPNAIFNIACLLTLAVPLGLSYPPASVAR